MKKHALIFVAVLLAVAIAMPAFAAVEFKYGGEFKSRITSENNTIDGTDMRGFYGPSYNSDDNRLAIDQRLRLYFTFVGSPNLKLVTKFEIGTSMWGQGGIFNQVGRTGVNLGTNEGGDAVAVEVKNVYIEFNIPNTPSTALIGLQTANLLDSWIINDDFPAAILVTKLDPFKITAGYVAGQNGWERSQGNFNPVFGNTGGGGAFPFTQPANSSLSATDQTYNVDDIFLALDYAAGPFKASLVGFYENGHDSTISADPGTLGNPNSIVTAATMGTFFANNGVFSNYASDAAWHLQSNQFFDLGLNLQYKVDWLLAYVSFVKNLGGFDIVGRPGGPLSSPQNPANPFPTSAANNAANALAAPNGAASINNQSPNYTGWMVDAGVTYFCGPWSVNVGGFYTTGPSIDSVVGNNGGMGSDAVGHPFGNTNKPFNGLSSTDVNWFTYPLAQTKYSSEIMGGGVLGDDWADGSYYVQRGTRWGAGATSAATGGAGIGSAAALSSMYWRNYPSPSNIWTISAGGSYQLTPTTKLSGSYWYWHTAEDVPVAFATHSLLTAAAPLGTAANPLTYKMDGSIGHELDFYLDQQIVDGLTLTIVGAYLFSDDAYCPLPFMSPAANQMGATTFVNAVNSGNYYTTHSENAYKLGARLLWAF